MQPTAAALKSTMGCKERPKYEGPLPVEGETYMGKITGIHPFGVFVEILPGAEDGSTPGFEGFGPVVLGGQAGWPVGGHRCCGCGSSQVAPLMHFNKDLTRSPACCVSAGLGLDGVVIF